MPAEGGVPQRLTWHPAPGHRAGLDAGWQAHSVQFAPHQLFPLPRAVHRGPGRRHGGEDRSADGLEGAYSPDGAQLAYVPISRAFTAWKRYRGGQATPIWIATLATSHIEKIPREGSNDFNPMWAGDKVYFLSDRDGPVTLYSYDTPFEAGEAPAR
jgi:tricorn protease